MKEEKKRKGRLENEKKRKVQTRKQKRGEKGENMRKKSKLK